MGPRRALKPPSIGFLSQDFRPNALQLCALQAVFLTGEAADAAWSACAGQLADGVPPALRGLAPLIFGACGRRAEPQTAARLERAYASSWLRLERARSLLSELLAKAADKECGGWLLLKGMALALGYYSPGATRSMSDVDVLVGRAHLADVQVVLAERGLRPASRLTQERLADLHSMPFRGRPGSPAIDLHWQLSRLCVVDTDGLFARSSPAPRLPGARLPAAADLLFHVLLHGACWSVNTRGLWVADALTLLRRGFDAARWERLVGLANGRLAAALVHAALAYLEAEFGAPVPVEVSGALRERSPQDRWTRLAARALSRAPPARSLPERLALRVLELRRRRGRE